MTARSERESRHNALLEKAKDPKNIPGLMMNPAL
jgi:hypothetical protein